jgi:pimeloyl-ACP methyl ester carboxylesterase
MPKVKVGDVNLHYLTVGRGPDMVMLHGFLGNLAVWRLRRRCAASSVSAPAICAGTATRT